MIEDPVRYGIVCPVCRDDLGDALSMHDLEAIMAVHVASAHGYKYTLRRPQLVAQILDLERSVMLEARGADR